MMRWLRKFRAWLGGWFWLPCPVCGEMFAGYEVRTASAFVPVDGDPYNGRVVCNKAECQAEAKRQCDEAWLCAGSNWLRR